MTLGQWFYIAAIVIYVFFFLLFTRFYFWKRYADRMYWNRRPHLSMSLLRRMARAQARARATATSTSMEIAEGVGARAGTEGRTSGTEGAEESGQLPFFSVLVPARNEADVIERTIDHMAQLDYPPDRFEVIIATDEKEVHARQAAAAVAVEFAHAFIDESRSRLGETSLRRPRVGASGGLDLSFLNNLRKPTLPAQLRPKAGSETERLVVGQLVDIGLKEGLLAGNPCLEGLPPSKIRLLADYRQFAVLLEIALKLVEGKGHIHMGRTLRLIRRARPDLDPEEARQAYPVYLSLAIPVVAAHWSLRSENRRRLVDRMVERTAHAHHGVTKKILASMTEVICLRILRRLDLMRENGRLPGSLVQTYRRCFPTTQDIVERKVKEFSATADKPTLKHCVVPYDFDGDYGGACTGRSVPSTKGRALNYALSHGFVDDRTVMCGFYDAESRPDLKVLQYIAYRRLRDGDKIQLFQGPIFQVRNFYEMGPFCKIACVYQALAHDWYLPVLFRRLPFVGGTNLFASRDLLARVKGYDHHSLTEDLELGTRTWLECGAWPEYLPYASTEQTPPTFKAFFRQRLRWGTGHLQTIEKVRNSSHPPEKKRSLIYNLKVRGQYEWVLYQGATLVPPVVLTLWYTGNLDPSILPEWVRWGLNFMSLVYFAFTIYAYYRYRKFFDRFNEPFTYLGRLGVFLQLFFLPLAAFFFPVPYTSALVLKTLGRQPKMWLKTPRTREF